MRFAALLIVLLSVQFALGQGSPKIQQISDSFHSNYRRHGWEYNDIRFEKRMDKWYVTALKYQNGNVVPLETALYFDPAIGYLKLGLLEADESDSAYNKSSLDDWAITNYNLHPFFGYEGWYKDVINLYAGKDKLSDDELYSLARAYSSYAMNLTRDTEFGPADEMFMCPFTINCLDNSQISKYNQVIGDAQKNFSLLAKQNPQYQTRVGSIAVKRAHEYVVQFHTMLTFAVDYSRDMQLPENIYPDSLISVSTAMLNDCPADAILVTDGDNDFYPLLYLQQQKKLRTDVHVVNSSLLGLDIYIYRATQPQFQAKGIALSFDTIHYAGTENDLLVFSDSVPSVRFSSIIGRIKSKEVDEVTGIKKLPSKTFLLNSPQGSKGKMLAISFKSPYVFKNDWILVDIIQNLGTRKLCFTNMEYLEHLQDHVVKKGSVWVLNN